MRGSMLWFNSNLPLFTWASTKMGIAINYWAVVWVLSAKLQKYQSIETKSIPLLLVTLHRKFNKHLKYQINSNWRIIRILCFVLSWLTGAQFLMCLTKYQPSWRHLLQCSWHAYSLSTQWDQCVCLMTSLWSCSNCW